MSKFSYPGMAVRPIHGSEVDMALDLFKRACQEQNFDCGSFFEEYRSEAEFWAVFDQTGAMAGAMMVVERERHELPVINGWPELAGISPHKACELAMVAVERDFRGMRYLFMPMYFTFFRFCKSRGIDSVYAILNKVIHRLYKRVGIVFEVVGDEKVYWGDPSIPCRLSIAELKASARSGNAELWESYREFMGEEM